MLILIFFGGIIGILILARLLFPIFDLICGHSDFFKGTFYELITTEERYLVMRNGSVFQLETGIKYIVHVIDGEFVSCKKIGEKKKTEQFR